MTGLVRISNKLTGLIQLDNFRTSKKDEFVMGLVLFLSPDRFTCWFTG